MKNFLLSLQFLFKPSYWLMNERYSAIWDKLLNNLLDRYTFKDIDEHTAKLGPTTIWIANHPYSSFVLHKPLCGRPSRLTIQRAYRQLESDVRKNTEDAIKAYKQEMK